MVGIVGYVGRDTKEESLLERMIIPLKHQGTYRIESYRNEYFACARVHRGIFNGEPQPIFNEKKSLCIFFDGKIYDYHTQLDELKKKGYVFRYQNDPEFCLHSYEEYGIEFVKKLNGSFVFVIYDLNTGKLILANDRYGHNMHYYAFQDGYLLFAPEIKAILQEKSFKREVNNEAVAEFLTFGEFWGTKTLFQGVHALAPATVLTYDHQALSIKKYWEFSYISDYQKSQKEFIDQLVSSFKRAVEIRMEDTLRHGITLSGGLDSRSVLGAVPKEKRKKLVACTFGPKDCVEVNIALNISKTAGVTEHDILETSPELILMNAENEVWLTEGRSYIGVSFAYPLLTLEKDKIDVIFDGYAMDLTLGGGYLKKEMLRCKNDEELRRLLHNIFFKKRIFQDNEHMKIFIPSFYDLVKDIPEQSFNNEFEKVKNSNLANKSDQVFINTRVTWMQIGDVPVRDLVEISHPTADNNFIDLIRTIPPEWRINHFIYRKFFKKLTSELATIPYNRTMVRPDAPLLFWKLGLYYIYARDLFLKKINTFSKGKIQLHNAHHYVDFDEWFRTNEQWQNFFKELLLNKDYKSKKYLNQDYVKQLFEEAIVGKNNNAMKLMYLATFELFLQKYF
jgi:asparagine synthase (glutamine-hydrolysing)